ncbi:MAG TPA: hypothetical protein VLD59_08150 [Steroidobacteraceae bacterium]|nr:hypothetical protein [Steroidobacteraceae bacterium]
MNDIATTNAFAPPVLQQFSVESAATAAASKAKALVEARYIMALRSPRNWDQVRVDLLKECKRPSFADNKSAFYIKPIGDGVEGLGIRFVEVALRCMKNVMVESEMTFEDTTKEVHHVTVTDLESNLPWSLDVNVSKSVERSKPADDGSYISVRKNSWGKNVYLVPAKGDDLLNIRAALISKAIRTLGLRIIPGDLQDEAESIIKAVRLDKAAKDPDAERKKILDSFNELGVQPTGLTEFLGHDIATCSPAEMVKLRGLYGAIRDGEATWASVVENKASHSGDPAAKNTLPDCTPEDFSKKSAEWRAVIECGKKSVNDLIATIQTKTMLTDDQKVEIAGWSVKGAST